MGRYIERLDHSIRFTKVNYFSAMDAPISIDRQLVLRAVLRMNGKELEARDVTEGKVLWTVAFDRDNPASVLNSISAARENARGARDIISTELWESINKFYHFILSYNQEAYMTTRLFDFSQSSLEQLTIIRGQIDNSLIHNEVWSIIKLGMYLERSAQILRSIRTKWQDMEEIEAFSKENSPLLTFQIATLMRGIESFDMSRKYYRAAPSLDQALEFLLLNDTFPRSLLSCLRKVSMHINGINESKHEQVNSAAFHASKSYWQLKHTTLEDMRGTELLDFISARENEIYTIGSKVVAEYFAF